MYLISFSAHCWYYKKRGHMRAECNFLKAKRCPSSESPENISRGRERGQGSGWRRGSGRGQGSGQRMFINVGGTLVSLYFQFWGLGFVEGNLG